MYVCSCRAVTDRTIRQEIASGARTIEEIAGRCGAGSHCGGCWPVLDEILAELLSEINDIDQIDQIDQKGPR